MLIARFLQLGDHEMILPAEIELPQATSTVPVPHDIGIAAALGFRVASASRRKARSVTTSISEMQWEGTKRSTIEVEQTTDAKIAYQYSL